MIFICSAVIVILILLFEVAGLCIKSYSFENETVRARTKHLLYPAAAYLIGIIKGLSKRFSVEGNRIADSYYEKIYIGEDCESAKRQCEESLISTILWIFLIISIFIVLTKMGGFYKTEYVASIKRPERGTKEFDITAIYGENSYDLELSIDEPYPTHQQMLERIYAVKERLPAYILGENESLESVSNDLNLKECYTDESVKTEWSSSDTTLVHTDGRVENENMILDREVKLTATLVCFEEMETVTFDLVIKPASEESAEKAFLIQTLEELFEKNQKEEVVMLPESIDEQEISFVRQKKDISEKIMLLGIIASVLIVAMWFENRRAKLKERESELMCDYPEVLSKFAMLMEAGLAIRKAFERIVIDYEKRKKNRKRRYVYEEMLKTRNELLLGGSEIDAYEAFGRRCGNIFYIRFASLLVQSVKKGSDSLMPHLHKEISEAMKEKQQLVKKRGEEVSIKLLLPMMGMFSLVLAIILIPAFLSM